MSFSIVFPGQGSQSVGMLASLADAYPVVKDTFAQASDVLGYDVFKLTQEGPVEELNQTSRTQPALLTASYAIWQVWKSLNGKDPEFMAGHSLGEYSALTCAGAIEFKDAVKLVEQRGIFMQESVPVGVGAMAAVIGLSDEEVVKGCKAAEEGQVCSAVNFNSQGQVVIAGNKEAVERASVILKDAGAKKIVPLPVSVPSHCQLMKPAADRLSEVLAGIKISAPAIPVINNVTGLGSVVNERGIKQKFIMWLFRTAYRSSACIMFQNRTNMQLAKKLGKGIDKIVMATAIILAVVISVALFIALPAGIEKYSSSPRK